MSDFQASIQPFRWIDDELSSSVILTALDYQSFIFASRAAEGFTGSGYDWASFAAAFLAAERPDCLDKIEFDPEADMFCASSQDAQALKNFIRAFKDLCEDRPRALAVFRQAALD